MRRHWALLARDLLALAGGLRSGIMLDYIPEPPHVIHQLLDIVRAEASSLTGQFTRSTSCSWPLPGFRLLRGTL